MCQSSINQPHFQHLTFDVGIVEHVGDGFLDLFQGRLEESLHGIGHDPHHSLRGPPDVLVIVLPDSPFHRVVLSQTPRTNEGSVWVYSHLLITRGRLYTDLDHYILLTLFPPHSCIYLGELNTF